MPGMIALDLELAKNQHFDLIELKVDGSRHSFKNNELFSDRGIVRNARYPHIAQELATMDWHVRGEVAIPAGNVLQLNKKENWHKAKYYIFDLYSYNGVDYSNRPMQERREILESICQENDFVHIELPNKFTTVDDGWDFVTSHDREGIVVKLNSGLMYKTKFLKEQKFKIHQHILGKSKGAFMIDCNGVQGKVSGTSMMYVDAYKELSQKGLEVFAEVEYSFLTDDGIPFQPRLRRLGTWQDLATDA